MKQLLLILSFFLISNCENNNSKDFKLKIQSTDKTVKLNDTINIDISSKRGAIIDSTKLFLNNKYKFAEIASSLAYYLKSFSNINKLLDYICLIFKHIFNEKIILIIPLNYEGEIWNENIKISANNECLKIQEEINTFLVFSVIIDNIFLFI